MAETKMNIEMPTRLCVVGDKVGHFHLWEHYSQPLAASLMIGGEPAGVYSQVFGIVEFDTGVERVDPTKIQFRDENYEALCRFNTTEEYRMQIMKGYKQKEVNDNGRTTQSNVSKN